MKELEKLKQQFNNLSNRERSLILTTICVIVLISIYWSVLGIINYQENAGRRAKAKITVLEQVIQASNRHYNLKSKLNELTTKYLNSSLSYEDLTGHLDKISKEALGADAYELIPSKDVSYLGENFTARKFTIKIRKSSYEQLVKILQALEKGPPPVFIQKVDLVKSSSGKEVSALLEIISIQENNS